VIEEWCDKVTVDGKLPINDFKSNVVYYGFSCREIREKYKFDFDSGKVFCRRSGNEVGHKRKDGTTIIGCRDKERQNVNLLKSWILYFAYYGYVPSPPHIVGFIDGNEENFSITNLVVTRRRGRVPTDASNWEEVEDGIFFDGENYLLRRGKKQSTYRTPVLDEARFVRDEWKSEPSWNRLDQYAFKLYENIGVPVKDHEEPVFMLFR